MRKQTINDQPPPPFTSTVVQPPPPEGVYEVYLNVYHYPSTPTHRVLRLLGFYHSTVQVHGREYTFSRESGIVSGIHHQIPCCRELNLHRSVLIGHTFADPDQVDGVVRAAERGTRFTAESYCIYTNNCHHFSGHLCSMLTGHGPWDAIMGLPLWPLQQTTVPVDDMNDDGDPNTTQQRAAGSDDGAGPSS